MWDDAVDRVIVEVAREMTAGAPGADLRARVMARIDETRTPRARARHGARGFQPGAWRAALAAAAMALFGSVVYHQIAAGPRGPALRTYPATSEADVRRPGPPGPGATGSAGPAATATSTTIVTAGPKRPALLSRVAIAPSPIDALAPPPLALAPLAVDTDLSAAPLDVAPIDTIAPIALAPIDEGDRR
jgi:hypothetical protein